MCCRRRAWPGQNLGAPSFRQSQNPWEAWGHILAKPQGWFPLGSACSRRTWCWHCLPPTWPSALTGDTGRALVRTMPALEPSASRSIPWHLQWAWLHFRPPLPFCTLRLPRIWLGKSIRNAQALPRRGSCVDWSPSIQGAVGVRPRNMGEAGVCSDPG